MASVVAMQLFSSRGRGIAVISLEHSQCALAGGLLDEATARDRGWLTRSLDGELSLPPGF